MSENDSEFWRNSISFGVRKSTPQTSRPSEPKDSSDPKDFGALCDDLLRAHSGTIDLGSSLSDTPPHSPEHQPFSLHIPASETGTRMNSPLPYPEFSKNPSFSPKIPDQLYSFPSESLKYEETGSYTNPRETDIANTLLEQLMLLRDRNESIKTYVTSLQTQVTNSLNLAISDLTNRRLTLISELDSYVEEQARILESAAKGKQSELKGLELDVETYSRRLQKAIEKLESFFDEGKASYKEVVETAEKVVELQAPDVPYNSEWAYIQSQEFLYTLHRKRTKSRTEKKAKTSRIPETESNPVSHRSSHHSSSLQKGSKSHIHSEDSRKKDQVILDLIQNYRHLETLYHKVRKGKKLPEDAKPVSISSILQGFDHLETDKFGDLMHQNKALEQRIASLESAVQSRTQSLQRSSMTPEAKARVTISALRAETDKGETPPFDEEPGIRLYVPFGHPAYSCYYILSMDADVTVTELLSSLNAHLHLSDFQDYFLTLKRTFSGKEVRLYNSEHPLQIVSSKQTGPCLTGWPRLQLRT